MYNIFYKKLILKYIYDFNHITRRMKRILNIIMNQFGKKISTNTPLGRWNIDYCLTKTALKIDQANEDHCGPCGHYIIKNTTNKQNDILTDKKHNLSNRSV